MVYVEDLRNNPERSTSIMGMDGMHAGEALLALSFRHIAALKRHPTRQRQGFLKMKQIFDTGFFQTLPFLPLWLQTDERSREAPMCSGIYLHFFGYGLPQHCWKTAYIREMFTRESNKASTGHHC